MLLRRRYSMSVSNIRLLRRNPATTQLLSPLHGSISDDGEITVSEELLSAAPVTCATLRMIHTAFYPRGSGETSLSALLRCWIILSRSAATELRSCGRLDDGDYVVSLRSFETLRGTIDGVIGADHTDGNSTRSISGALAGYKLYFTNRGEDRVIVQLYDAHDGGFIATVEYSPEQELWFNLMRRGRRATETGNILRLIVWASLEHPRLLRSLLGLLRRDS
jgi:hypothetical protein